MTRGEYGNPGDMSSPCAHEQLVAPFRQAQSLLGRISDAARNIADESLFNQLLSELSVLPDAATFSPLQTTCQLPVDIPPAQQPALQEAETKRQFMDALQQGARERSVRAGALGEKAATRQSITVEGMASEPPAAALSEIPAVFAGFQRQVIDIQRRATEVSMGELPPVLPVSGLQETFRTPFLGSWAALERIAEMVQLLEPQASSEEDRSPAAQPAGSLMGASPKDGVTSSGSGARGEHMAQASPQSTGSSAGESGSAAMGAISLQALVNAVWEVTQTQTERQGRKADSVSASRKVRYTFHNSDRELQARTTIAPSSPSMLTPRLAPQPASSSAGGITAPAARTVATTVAATAGDAGRGQQDRSGLVPQGAAANHDEELAEQLNRALIEQAWRGGVDLT